MQKLEIYQLSFSLGENIWELVVKWQWFAKETTGKQLVRSADSIAANIAEGHGRYSFKERTHHAIIARGSLRETQCWLQKCLYRGLVEQTVYEVLKQDMDVLLLKLNRYIQANRTRIKKKG